MPSFRYTAITAEGKRINQTLVAGDSSEVAKQLAANNLFIVEIKEATGTKSKGRQRLNASDKIFFTQNLSVLLSSGISLGESLATIAHDTPNKSVAAFYNELRTDLERGSALSQALSNYPNVFDSVYIALIEAGENSGRLDSVMNNLAESLEKDVRMYNQVKSALLYPLFVLGALFLLGFLIIFFVLPRITKVFESLKVTLPITTQWLVSFGRFATNQPLVLLAILLGGSTTILLALRSKPGKRVTSHISARLPFLRQIIVNLDLSRLSSTLALLLNAGVPIQRSLEIAGATVRNPRLQEEFKTTSQKLANGVSLGQAFQDSSLPKTFIALVGVGERSGKIANVFATMADHYTNLLDTSVKNFTGVLEPLMTLVVGLLVGGVVITVMLPLYQLIGNLNV